MAGVSWKKSVGPENDPLGGAFGSRGSTIR